MTWEGAYVQKRLPPLWVGKEYIVQNEWPTLFVTKIESIITLFIETNVENISYLLIHIFFVRVDNTSMYIIM